MTGPRIRRGTVHLLVGPVGAGKTTFGRRRAADSRAVFLDLDSWMVRLYGDDTRPSDGVMDWYLERRDRCRELLWDVALSVIHCATDVFLELGLVRRAERESFYRVVHDQEIDLQIYLLDAPRDVRRQRVVERNRSSAPFVQIVPPEFFEIASDAWEPPSESERRDWNLLSI